MSSEVPDHAYKIQPLGMCKREHCHRISTHKVYTGNPGNKHDGDYCELHAAERVDELNHKKL